MVRAYIGLGSNQGDRLVNLRKALDLLAANNKVKITKVASLYETDPVGYLEQDCFYNTVAELETTAGPQELLKILLGIEDQIGRVRTIRWGPRTIDLDLLVYGCQRIREQSLEVPHPLMLERAFVMAPLAELNPFLRFENKICIEFLENLKNFHQITCIKTEIW